VTLPGPLHSHPESEGTALEDLLRELAPQVLGVIMRRLGGLDVAEDAVQEALIAAARHWRDDGVPENPRGWLIQAAARKMTDQIRSEQSRRRREANAAVSEPEPAPVPARDDTLTLLFMCCHPALTPPSAIALTLRAVGGLTTAEIASAFLVPEATMAQRISRAKQSIKSSGVPFALPGDDERDARLRSVLHVLYLIFNEGYVSRSGPDLHRHELSGEAIRLTRAVHALLPGDGQVTGLLALMLLTEARRPARTGPDGDLVPLAEQDRSSWDQRLIGEGVALAVRATTQGRAGDYQIQAAIAALHDEAPTAADTDWPQILALYGVLERLTGNPMVTLNRAVAAAMVEGPAAGLRLLEPLDERLPGHYRLDAVRAHLFELLGDTDIAMAHYQAAARKTMSVPERNYLLMKAARLKRA
jgi:RNA polymerase sigma factor (sigma-70 family)